MSFTTTERENVPGFCLTLILVSIIARGWSNAGPKQRMLPISIIVLQFSRVDKCCHHSSNVLFYENI